MSAKKRKDRRSEWWIDFRFRYPDGRVERVRRRSPVQTRRGADQYERQLRDEMLNPSPQPKSEVPTLAEFAPEFLATYSATKNKYATCLKKNGALKNHLIPFFGRTRLDEISAHRLAQYSAEKLEGGYTNKSINNQLSHLRVMLTTARKWSLWNGELPEFDWLRVPPAPFDFLDFLDFDEARRLVAGADEGKWRTMIRVALNTGLRQGELLASRWQDAKVRVVENLSAGQITTPKNGRTRTLPLNRGALVALNDFRHLRGPRIFCRDDGLLHTPHQRKWPLWRACARAGLRRIGWHVLRHTFASHLVMRGVPLKASKS